MYKSHVLTLNTIIWKDGKNIFAGPQFLMTEKDTLKVVPSFNEFDITRVMIAEVNDIFDANYRLNYIQINDHDVFTPIQTKKNKYYFYIDKNITNVYFNFIRRRTLMASPGDEGNENELENYSYELDYPLIKIKLNICNRY